MFDANSFWRNRLENTYKELWKYYKYVVSQLINVIIIGLGFLLYYYLEWIKNISDNFPIAFLLAFILAMVLTYSPIFTFLKEADHIFLLPLEKKLITYFNNSIILSYSVQLFIIIICLSVTMPLYSRVYDGVVQSFFKFLFIMSITKLLNILIKWWVQFYSEKQVHIIDSCVRFAINTVLLYFLFSNVSNLFWMIEIVLLIGLYIFFKREAKQKGLKWEFLIKQNQQRMTSFYRFANFFIDVPKLKEQVKRRKFLDFFSSRISYSQNQTFYKLFTIAFIRSGDYFNLYIRLTLIGGFIVYFSAFRYGQVILVLVVLFLTGFQLLSLWKHHHLKIWIYLYPTSHTYKLKAFQNLLSRLLCIQVTLFSVLIFICGEYLISGLAFIFGIIFAYGFVYLYSKKKLTI
ncbi:ABC transporter permease [Bacillus solimangrovi]|uniref:ABC transporter permease n=1 Tax=Bacillus solimangrovi TaxID=1305675 RepID=A0A1E5LF32_9BACI|nr:ABC transporter permease [Bacillus solimangrovi]OEH92684.1 ABC transporter permease [Bacillus solimangrovi]